MRVVGHTDDVGEAAANMEFSLKRAAAVVSELSGPTYKIARARLVPEGAGPYVPVATNRNEAGRAKNRRVELVERIKQGAAHRGDCASAASRLARSWAWCAWAVSPGPKFTAPTPNCAKRATSVQA